MWNRWKFTCVFVAAAQLASAAVAQQVPTESGTISGARATGVSVYKGIPFAAPPVGDLRWRPPVHAASWTGTRKADAFAPACPKCVTIAGQSSGSISVSILMASPLAKGLFQRAIGESGGLFEPLQLAPKFLLANAERDGDEYAAALGAPSLKELRGLPASLFTGNAGGIVHAVIEPYVLPLSPYEAFASGQQNDVPLQIGSNAEEARAMVDVSHETAATFDSDLEHSVGPLPPALVAAYPHTTDEEARPAQLDLERDLRFGWGMWAWARLQAGTGKSPVFYYSFRQPPPFPAGSVYAGWGASHFAELWYVFEQLDQSPWNWTAADRNLAEEVSSSSVNFARSGDPNGPGLPLWAVFTNAQNKVQYLAAPITVGGVANIRGLSVFDAVYTTVRGTPFALGRRRLARRYHERF